MSKLGGMSWEQAWEECNNSTDSFQFRICVNMIDYLVGGSEDHLLGGQMQGGLDAMLSGENPLFLKPMLDYEIDIACRLCISLKRYKGTTINNLGGA